MATRTPGPGDLLDTFSRLLRAGVLLLAGAAILAYGYIAGARIGHPYELEWIEGAVVDHVARVLAGQPLYVAPTLEFAPLIYAPFYFYASALVASVTGIGFFPLRLLSTVSSVAIFVLIFELVRRETRSRFAAFVAIGIFAATFRFAGAWLDTGRIDSLAFALVLAAALLVRFGSSRLADVAAAVALVLAFHTKQSAAAFLVVLAIYVVVARRRRALLFVGTAAVLLVASLWGLAAAHDGWYGYYVYDLPAEHPLRTGQTFDFWWTDVLKPLPVLVLLAVAWFVREWFSGDRTRWLFYFLFCGGLVGSAWLPRMHFGAWDNNRIPACVAFAILAGLAIGAFQNATALRRPVRLAIEAAGAAALLLQFALVGYQPQNQVPTRADREAGDELVALVRDTPGDVLVLHHGYMTRMAGKRPFAHWQAIADVIRASDARVRDPYLAAWRAAVRERRFSAILLDGPDFVSRDLGIDEHYRLERTLTYGGDPNRFLSVTGVRRRPGFLYVPKATLSATE